jgi:hypothetical protein
VAGAAINVGAGARHFAGDKNTASGARRAVPAVGPSVPSFKIPPDVITQLHARSVSTGCAVIAIVTFALERCLMATRWRRYCLEFAVDRRSNCLAMSRRFKRYRPSSVK